MLKKFSIFLIFGALLFLATPAFAQTPTPYTLPASSFNPTASISPTSPQFTDLIMHNTFHTFSCLMVGGSIIGQPCLTYQVTQNAQGAVQSVPVLSEVNFGGGVLGTTGSLIGLLYKNPPVRTSDYLASLSEQFGVKKAHAQVVGSGAEVLRPIEALWQVSRNIAYVIMIIIFLIIGLMVMFRQRINPQTVITAQASLPGLVLGLIMITFSYFLAGLVSDMAFVGTNFVGYYFAAAQGKTDDPDRVNLVNTISGESMFGIFSPLVGIVTQERASEALNSVWDKLGEAQGVLRVVAGLLSAHIVAPLAGGVPAGLGSASLFLGPALTLISIGAGALGAPFFLGFFISFAATLALIYQMLKLLLRLIASYLTIIFLTITAPFQLLVASLPGRQGIATAWILNMLGNILIFPAVLAVFYFIAFLLGPNIIPSNYPLKISQSNHIDNNSFVVSAQSSSSQITGTSTFPMLGGLDLNFINLLLAFGALMALPKIPDIVVSAIGRMGQTGQLLGQEIAGGIGSGQRYYGQATGSLTETTGSLKRGVFGQYGYRYEPGVGFKYGPVQPGIAQGLDRSASGWNPFKWKMKPP